MPEIIIKSLHGVKKCAACKLKKPVAFFMETRDINLVSRLYFCNSCALSLIEGLKDFLLLKKKVQSNNLRGAVS